VAVSTSVVGGAILTDTIDQLRINNSAFASIKQVGNVDVIQVENTDNGTIDEIGICHIPIYCELFSVHFVYFYVSFYCNAHVHIIICSLLVLCISLTHTKILLQPIRRWTAATHCIAPAVYLAMEHLNNGDGSVIPDVKGLNERCPIRFTTEMIDSKRSPAVAVDKAIEIISRENRTTCALAGAGRSPVTIPLAIISGIRDIPQISPLSTSEEREYILLVYVNTYYLCMLIYIFVHTRLQTQTKTSQCNTIHS